MNKTILAAASFEKQKYYINPEFLQLPNDVKKEVRDMCIVMAQKLMCTFVIGFFDDGNMYFDFVKTDDAFDFDTQSFKNEKAELIKSLKMWYMLFKTSDGERIRKSL